MGDKKRAGALFWRALAFMVGSEAVSLTLGSFGLALHHLRALESVWIRALDQQLREPYQLHCFRT